MEKWINVVTYCQHPDCKSREIEDYESPDGETTEYFCDAHAKEHGYCLGCRTFCAGIESYDFSTIPGYCYECVGSINAEIDDETDYDEDDDFDEDYY